MILTAPLSLGLQPTRTRSPDPGGLTTLPDISHRVAVAWLTSLEYQPFRPSEQQLQWVDGGDLVVGEGRARRMRVAATRYAGLFADHVAQDVNVEGGPGAYALVWQCARKAFIEGMGDDQAPAASARQARG